MAEQLLSTTVHDTVPVRYVRPESQRPRLAEVVAGARIPVVDLACPDRAAVVADIGNACRSHGFFQVLNHGIDARLIADVMAVAREFFRLPPEEKAKLYSDDPARKMRLSTSFNVRKETVHNWRDYLRLHCHPLEQFVPDWPSNPPEFKETMSTYCKEVRALGFRLYEAISESLGLEADYIGKTLGEQEQHSLGLEAGYIGKTLGEQEQHIAVNFYLHCPATELTYGLPAHTDPNALTIRLMDQEVAGLQVLNGGKWVAVNPQPGALVVNIGDQLQALSNGEYRSVWHRAVLNSDRERLPVAEQLLSTAVHDTVRRRYVQPESWLQRDAEAVAGAVVDLAGPDCAIASVIIDTGAQRYFRVMGSQLDVTEKLERSMLEIQQMLNGMALLVAMQGEQLDHLEGNMHRARSFVERSRDQLQAPSKRTFVAILILFAIFVVVSIMLKNTATTRTGSL